ncbi:adenylyltransferase/cytidyltransferase family protein [Pseudalkalibacillus caeni]|uniref:Riboflavin biosynthesis protein n=1 Tax=Exobacillus caeni TaxID=2574798 RepID=A0A5R9F308_9BACL|nr:adenylyltransferase/cytidyltransferase family protein [Pseudalkalibacillus caeni]TLS36879.1 cytidyltransferase [Pseudalkalibacillus caeni]
MRVTRLKHPIDAKALENNAPCVMALGFFDGVHRGHQRIIETAKKIAEQKQVKLSVMTFYPHPSQLIKGKEKITHYLSPLPIKMELFKEQGVEQLFIVDFNLDFAKVNHANFVKQYLVGLNCRHVVAGFDFRYGFKGEGSMQTIEQDGAGSFDVTTVSKMEEQNEKISSTKIRELLSEGNVGDIPLFLGDYYLFVGKAKEPFYLKGKKEKFVEVFIDENYLLPSTGSYEVQLEVEGKKYKGIADVDPIRNKEFVGVKLFEYLDSYDGKMVKIKWIKKCPDEEVPTSSGHKYQFS